MPTGIVIELLTFKRSGHTFAQSRGDRYGAGAESPMLKLLERSIATLEERLVVVAPARAVVPSSFADVRVESSERRYFVREAQRLRGSVYLRDGAIQEHQLTPDGLHQTPEDDRSWHLLMTDGARKVTACIWLMELSEDASFQDLRVRNSPLAFDNEWRPKLWYAVESDLARARAEDVPYAEVGGWAVAEGSPCTDGLLMALAAYSLARTLDGALAMTTATARHSSSAILRRLGGESLKAKGEEIPAYFDPHYGCTMEILRFDSKRPQKRFESLVHRLWSKLTEVPTVTAISVPMAANLPAVSAPRFVA
jgi:hypothetical protein